MAPDEITRSARLRGLVARGRRGLAWIRIVALPLVLVLATAKLATVVHAHYPIQKWLFWRYAGYWLTCAGWALACVTAGHAVVVRILRRTLPVREHLAIAFAVGVFTFFLGMFLGGLLGLYGGVFFVAWPLVMLAAAARPALRYGRRLARHLRHRRRQARPPPLWTLPLLGLGLLGIVMVYIAILSPENVAFDSRWQHLGLAEHYAATGAVRRFPEGWFMGTSPHLSSFLYTWAFLRPASTLFDRVELSSHIEFTIFLFTLAAIPALVRRMVPKARARGAWVGRFLFAGVFVYDSSLGTAADHVAALFAIPIFLLLLRSYRELCPRFCVLSAMMIAAAFLTKYTGALILIAFPLLALALRTVVLGVRALIRRPLPGGPRRFYLGPAIATAAGLVFTAPHWLKNWIWYGDPFYPVLHRYFTPRPWTPRSAERFDFGYMETLWRPTRNLAGIKETLKALYTFSFIPNDYPKFHGAVPVFGSLFTLTLLCLPFVRGARRLWALFGAVHVGIFIWYWTHHQDRYLQAVVPWMAAATVSALILVWRTHFVARIAAAGLVALQVVWGGDVYFIAGHAMLKSPPKAAIDLLSTGYRKDWKARERIFAGYSDAGAALPKGAKVLVHDHNPHLGLQAMSVNDGPLTQGGIDYGHLPSDRAVHDLLSGFGVTHLFWVTTATRSSDTIASNLAFLSFAQAYGVDPKSYGPFTLARMPAAPPEDAPFGLVALFGCAKTYPSGLYHLGDLDVPYYGPRKATFPEPLRAAPPGRALPDDFIREAAFLVIDSKCHDAMPAAARSQWKLGAKRSGTTELWLRSRSPDTTAPRAEPRPQEPPDSDLDDELYGPTGQ